MSLVRSGIDRVRAFGLAGGISSDGISFDEPMSVVVKWRSQNTDKLHQVYVNGRLAGVTADCQQRQAIVAIPLSLFGAVRIEVFAVEASEADVDFSDQLDSGGQAGRIKVSWLRGLSLPFCGQAEIYSNAGSGEINYDGAVSREPVLLWPGWQDKGGFGLSRFARSDFGYDSSASVGFGRGLFGEGEFGFDADEIGWVSGQLATGVYKFGVKVRDRLGNCDGDENESGQVTVIRSALPAGELTVNSYDKVQNSLVLDIN